MMTTMAALLGGLPLAFGSGIGSELRRPLGIAMVGGLMVSQVLTLYTTPVIYIFFDNLAQRFSKQKPKQEAGAHAPAQGDAGRGNGPTPHPEGARAMNPSAPFIYRPVATILLTVAIAIAGGIAFNLLPVSPLPQVDFPTISVAAQFAGRQRGDHGVVRRNAAGAAVRPHRRCDGDDFVQQRWAQPPSPSNSI